MKNKETNSERKWIYTVRFLLGNPVHLSSGQSKLLIINSTIGEIDKTFLIAVSQKLKSQNLSIVRTDGEGHPVYLTSPKDLISVIKPELRCKKESIPNNRGKLLITTATGKSVEYDRNAIHNLYINDEDYERAKRIQ